MSDTARLLALNAGFVAVGAVGVLVAGIPRTRMWVPTLVGVAPAAGLALCGLAATLGAMVGVDVGLVTTFVIAVAALAVAAAVTGGAPRIGSLEAPQPRLLVTLVEVAGLALLAALSFRLLRFAAATGLGTWDGWALWAPKAHALFVDGDIWGPVFRDPEYFMQHQEYPVLLPSLEALAAEALGRFDQGFADLEAAAVLVAFGWAVWGILRLVVSPPVAAGAAFALVGSTRLITNVGANYADTAVAAFVSLGVLCVLVWLAKDAPAMRTLGTLFLAAGALTKSEGLLFALAAIVAVFVVARGAGQSLRTAAAFAAQVLALPALWALVDRLNGPGAKNVDASMLAKPGELVDAVGRIPTATARLIEEIADGWALFSLAVLVSVAAAWAAKVVWPAVFVGIWSALALSALVSIYFLSTNDVDWLLATSADRVVYSIVLAPATVAPLLVGLAWERLRSGRAGLRSPP